MVIKQTKNASSRPNGWYNKQYRRRINWNYLTASKTVIFFFVILLSLSQKPLLCTFSVYVEYDHTSKTPYNNNSFLSTKKKKKT